MKVTMQTLLWALVACLSLWPILVFAQSSDVARDLEACKNGRATCDRSKLAQSESAEVAVTEHARAVSNCRNRLKSCDPWKLTGPEATALAVADHQRNASDCREGIGFCDRSKLTQSEVRDSSVAEHQRNFSDCRDGRETLRLLGTDSNGSRRIGYCRAQAQLHGLS
jgi:hypothetical protein